MPSAATIIPAFFPLRVFSLSTSIICLNLHSFSGTRITSAPTVMPTFNAKNPRFLPITSTMKIRSWEIAVSLILSISVTPVFTAVSKPMVSSVPKTSLSMVAGTPTIRVLLSLLKSNAPLNEPSPPITTKPSTLLAANVLAAFFTPFFVSK